MIAFTASATYYILSFDGEGSLASISLADIGYLAFCPLMLGALAVAVVRQLKDLPWPLLLDTVVGALAAASLMVLILEPVLTPGTEGTTLEVMVAVLHPRTGHRAAVAVPHRGAARLRGLRCRLRARGRGPHRGLHAGWTAGMAAIAVWAGRAASGNGATHRRRHRIPDAGDAAMIVQGLPRCPRWSPDLLALWSP